MLTVRVCAWILIFFLRYDAVIRLALMNRVKICFFIIIVIIIVI